MFVETTYPSREISYQIDKKVGKAYSLIERIKMGGIGSKRMSIEAISPEYNDYLNPEYYVTQANIELRPKGIIIHFRYKLESYALIMEYKELTIETGKTLIFHFGDKFIQFRDGLVINAQFVKRIQERLASN